VERFQKKLRSFTKPEKRGGIMKRYGRACFVWVLTALCILVFIRPAQSEEKTVRLKFSTFSPPMSRLAGLAEQWCKEVEKRGNGKIKVAFFPGGTLVPANQSYEGAVRGITDISFTSQQWTAGRFPLTEGVALPIGIKSSTQGTKLINAWYKKFKPKEYDDVKVLYMFTSGPSHFMTLKQLTSINQLKGLKIRAAGETSKIVIAMGAVPVSVPISDAYEAFQRGVCEGVLLAAETLKSFRWGDLLRGLQSNDGIGSVSTLLVVMNTQKWNSLPPDVQKIIEQVSEEWAEKTGPVWDDIDRESIEFARSQGLKTVVISKEEVSATIQKMKPLLDAYVAKMKTLGLPGEQSLKFCTDFLRANP
jgi:TRAP-type C4-dicarboxylate transport system substrate-binding protein